MIGNDGDVGDAHILEDTGDRDETCSVQRRVDQLEACGLAETRADLARFDCFIQSILAVLADEFDEALFHAFCEGHVFGTGQDIGLLDGVIDDCGCVICHLAAIGAVSLEAVVFCRVVRRCDHDTCVAVIIAGCEAQSRNGHQLVVDADLDAVCSQNACRVTCEVPAFETAVIADSYGLVAALGLDPLCNTLCSLTDYPDVHTVCACAESAAKTCGTEGQRDRKALFDGIVVACKDHSRSDRLPASVCTHPDTYLAPAFFL